jgi:hypothetical protein
MKFYAQRKIIMDAIDLHLLHGDDIATNVTFVRRDPAAIVQPFLQLEMAEAQRLMDVLWDCGLRPSEGSGSAGSLAATERHLADMRQLAFHALKVAK